MKIFGGSVSVTATGVTEKQMASAMTKSLAKKFSVTEKSVYVKATESRRLAATEGLRRLAGTWAIAYSITAPVAQATAITATMTDLKASPDKLKTELKAQLVTAGVAQSAVDSLGVSSFTGSEATRVKKNGYLSIVAPTSDAAQVGKATTKLLAKHFKVSETSVVVMVRDKTWIVTNLPSGTTGDYGVEWTVYVSSGQDDAATSKISAMVSTPSDLTTDLRTYLVMEGVTIASGSSVSYVQDLSTKPAEGNETSGAFSILRQSGKYSLALAIIMSTFTSTKISLPALWRQGHVERA
jgi:hypothetical protein